MRDFIAAASAREAHALRLAAIACELGRQLGFDRADLAHLKAAALQHNDSQARTRDVSSRVANDMFGAVAPAAIDSGPAERILEALRDTRKKTLQVYTSVEILLIAEAIDGWLEFEPFTAGGAEPGMWESPFAQAGLSVIRRTDREALRRAAEGLPVFASHALRLLVREDVGTSQLERLAAIDPVLADAVVSHANSAPDGPRDAIRSASAAIMRVGAVVARRLMMAALVRPMYQSACMRPLWRHAAESADVAAHFAERAGLLTASEAALAGLVHDVGVLAMSMLHPEAVSACNRLRAAGCPRAAAEWIVCGFDHAEAGAVMLETWGFSTDLVEAVRFHHAPEKSNMPLAAILYLAEFWTAEDEDLPSIVRLNLAAKRLHLPPETVHAMRPSRLISGRKAEDRALQALTM